MAVVTAHAHTLSPTHSHIDPLTPSLTPSLTLTLTSTHCATTARTPGHSSPCTNANNRVSSYYIACGPRQPEADSLTGGVSGVQEIVEGSVWRERVVCTTNNEHRQHHTPPHHAHATPRHLYHAFQRTTRASHVSIDHVKIVLVEVEQANCSCAYTTVRCTRQHMTTQSINATVISPSVTTTPHTHTHTHCSHSTGKSARTATRARA
jgi:hypothetical protein